MDIIAAALLRRSHKTWTEVTLFAANLLMVSAMAAEPNVDRRLPTADDIREARNALMEFLPEEYVAYKKMRRGYTEPMGTKYVLFFTADADNIDQVSRVQQVRCWPQNKVWKCSGPTTRIFYRRHDFPEPSGIDDKTIAEIVDFHHSSCASDQRLRLEQERTSGGRPRLPGPGISHAILPIREWRKIAEGYAITVGSGGTGHTFSVTRNVDPSAACGFQLELTGSYIS